jgi:hypothetical protein
MILKMMRTSTMVFLKTRAYMMIITKEMAVANMMMIITKEMAVANMMMIITKEMAAVDMMMLEKMWHRQAHRHD